MAQIERERRCDDLNGASSMQRLPTERRVTLQRPKLQGRFRRTARQHAQAQPLRRAGRAIRRGGVHLLLDRPPASAAGEAVRILSKRASFHPCRDSKKTYLAW